MSGRAGDCQPLASALLSKLVLLGAAAMPKVGARVRIPAAALPAPHDSKIHNMIPKAIADAARGPGNYVLVGLGQGRKGVQVPGSDCSDNRKIPDDDCH
jgi:hypothetical protein